jgi:signal transduction histidine kinase
VRLRLERHADRARLLVCDRGRGIPAAFQARVFDRFSQADASTTRAVSGTGLGLAIARELVQRMGGEIGFASEEGRGSTFFVDLPLAAGAPDA